VEDRKGHDFRYDIDNSRRFSELGWRPTTTLPEGLFNTIEWYEQNTEWVKSCLDRLELSA